MKTIELDGNKFNDINSFYDEVVLKLCPKFDGFGRNFDAFSDVLIGGFGVHEPGEQIEIIWNNAAKSKNDLDYAATANYYENALNNYKYGALQPIKDDLDAAQNKSGPTLFDTLVEIIKERGHILKLT